MYKRYNLRVANVCQEKCDDGLCRNDMNILRKEEILE